MSDRITAPQNPNIAQWDAVANKTTDNIGQMWAWSTEVTNMQNEVQTFGRTNKAGAKDTQ